MAKLCDDSFHEQLRRLIDVCDVCGNSDATRDGHRPGCPRGTRQTCSGCHLYPCVEDSTCSVWLEAAHRRMQQSCFDDAELWYAREVARMSERAPA